MNYAISISGEWSQYIKPKLTIGQPNDQYEREADAVADQVMSIPASQIEPIQRKCDPCEEEEELQMKPLTAIISPIIQKQEEEEELRMKPLATTIPPINQKQTNTESTLHMECTSADTVIQKEDEPTGTEPASSDTEATVSSNNSLPNLTLQIPSPLILRANGVMYTSPTFLVQGPNGSIVDLAPYTGNGLVDFPLAALESLGIPILSYFQFHMGRARQYLGQHFDSAYGLSGGTSFIRNALHYGYITADDVTLFGAPSSFHFEHYQGIPNLNIVANPMDIGTMINVSYFNYPLVEGHNNPAVLFTITAPFSQNPFEAFVNLGGAMRHAISGDLYNLPNVTHNYPRFQEDPNREIGTPTTTTQISPKANSQVSPSRSFESKLNAHKEGGQSLPIPTREFMQKRIGADFSEVTVHTGTLATSLNKDLGARAFTNGSDIYFNQGQYNPKSAEGKRLLAHELTHVVQQGKSPSIQCQGESELAVDLEGGIKTAAGGYSLTNIGQPGRIGARIYDTVTGSDNFNDIKSTGKKIHTGPAGTSPVKFRLRYNELIQVVGINSEGWAFISSPEGFGWVQSFYIHYPIPDLKSELHFVQSGEYLKDVIAQHYSGQSINLRAWGEDVRFYVHAVALVNENREGIGYYNSKKDLSLFREMFLDKTGEQSQQIWNSAYLKKGHNIWLPSLDIINQMKSQGLLSSGSVSYTALEAFKDFFLFNVGLQIGVFEGLWAALVDTLQGIVDLVKLIGTLVQKIINGELLDYLKEIWEGLKSSVLSLPSTLQKAWEEFMAKSAFDKGRAVGKIIGMILFEVLIAYFTAGVVTALKWSGKAGRLVSAFRKLPDIQVKSKKITSKVDPPDAATKKKISDHVENKSDKQAELKIDDAGLGDSSPEVTSAVSKVLSRGAKQARDLGWPDPPGEGYFWVYRKSGKPYLSRSSKVERKYFDEGSGTFKDGNPPVASTAHLPDYSGNYDFPPLKTLPNGTVVKSAKGKLGVPGEVRKHRSQGSQKNVSSGTGDDAGHLIGDRFGAPGTEKNLSRQNWKANQGGGTFYDLENKWDALLQEGWEIEVKVSDLTKKGADRPYTRRVEWTGKGPNGEHVKVDNVEYVNFQTKKSRKASGHVPKNNNGELVELDDYR